jgi:hypothetical protein
MIENNHGHPTLAGQSGMGKTMYYLLSKVMNDNPTYFNDFNPTGD